MSARVDREPALVATDVPDPPRWARVRPMARQAIGVVAVQGVVQAANLLSGLLVIRALPPEQYARYALAFGMLGTLAVLADAGVSAGVMAHAGRRWPDARGAGAAVAAGLRIRRWLVGAAGAVTLPLLAILLVRHGTDGATLGVALVSVAAAAVAGATSAVWEVPLKLAGDLRRLQTVQVGGAALRLACIAAAAAWAPGVAALIVVGVAAQLASTAWLRRAAARHVDVGGADDPDARRAISRLVGRSLPGAAYFCLSGQITLWLASVLGATTTVADVGALGRLAMILTPITSLVGILAVPRIAALRGDLARATGPYFAVQGCVAALAAAVLVAVAVAPGAALWLLGPSYANLQREVVLLALASGVGLVAAAAFAMNGARGVSAPGWVSPAVSTAVIALTAVVADLGSVHGALLLSLALNVSSVVTFNATFLVAARRGTP
jgi:hypothetical protein